jgi:hypothetical protein
MTDKALFALGEEDGAIVFRADGTYELRFGRKAKQAEAAEHLLLMIGLHGMLSSDDEVKAEVIEYVDEILAEEAKKRTEKVWSN